ncbi:NAD(P)/FAD-dependent oxidoreductase [Bradyrhizobium sp. NP1]|uniref:FAD-dependent oxidoreductase n=1 Tax=Bradyrhizobium sp. NP1 TaxID=3049772 RepID=UPI0025A52610|nr:NAD(P)/FAD-dependent oxidoreductase [Bradyrhizobium sp. NP1]WJR79215.1 NAD(P)/FAD-dependent oxidoreductase [Bradyrhizobium sp. NP1]
MTEQMLKRAEIAGAGIAGLTVAIALAQRGWRVRIHERSATLRESGAGIYIWENGLRVLEALDAYDKALDGCHRGFMRETRNDKNQVVASTRWGGSSGLRVVSIVRQQLLTALLRAATSAGAKVLFGSEVIGATHDGTALLAGGDRAEADLVIAADGVNSRIRDQSGLLKARRRLADGAIRLMIERTPLERETEAGKKYVEYWSGTRRVLYTPCSETKLYLALTALATDEAAKTIPLRKDVWKGSFPHLAALFDRVGAEGRWDQFEAVKLRRWSRGRVAIIGDAAHAQAPNLGQGGGCAMMSALGLAVALQESSTIEQGLMLWERRERALIDRTQTISSLYSRITTFPPIVRDAALSLAGRSSWLVAQRMRAANHRPTGTY